MFTIVIYTRKSNKKHHCQEAIPDSGFGIIQLFPELIEQMTSE